MINENNYNLASYYEEISKISSILLRKDISTKEIYVILLAAKLINKNFNLEDIAMILEHMESMFTHLQTNTFSNKKDFNKWESFITNKIQTNKNEENK
jgi:hypothetical protein